MSRLRPELPEEAAVRDGSARALRDLPRSVAADAVRDAIDILVSREIPDDVLLAESAAIEASVARMAEAAAPGRRTRKPPDITGHPQEFFSNGPTAGWANPLALPIEIWGVDTEAGIPEIRGRAIFSLAYEGPPTCVHGGVIALVFDEILGNANLLADRPGMTGTLKIRYSKPTPLLTTLELEARMLSVDGRKVTTYGAIKVDGVVTAEAEGIFISVAPEKMMSMAQKNASGAAGEVIDPTMAKFIEEASEGKIEP